MSIRVGALTGSNLQDLVSCIGVRGGKQEGGGRQAHEGSHNGALLADLGLGAAAALVPVAELVELVQRRPADVEQHPADNLQSSQLAFLLRQSSCRNRCL